MNKENFSELLKNCDETINDLEANLNWFYVLSGGNFKQMARILELNLQSVKDEKAMYQSLAELKKERLSSIDMLKGLINKH